MAFSRAVLPLWLLELQSGEGSSFLTIPKEGRGRIRDLLHADPSTPCAQELPGMGVDQRPLGPPGCWVFLVGNQDL